MSDNGLHSLDNVFTDILAGASPSGRKRTARSIGTALRASQQRRIKAQRNPDGSEYPQRRRKTVRTQAGISFIWEGQLRQLKNWHHGRGRYGRTITGFDVDRNAIRTFYRADIERYMAINLQRGTAAQAKPVPMFQRLRTARFMKMAAGSEGADVGYNGMAARIARIHQYGLRDQVGPGISTKYPIRELLGISRADEALIRGAVINSLGSVAR